MGKYIKDHKIIVAATIFLIVLIIAAFFIKEMFFKNSDNAVYGNRLDGIETVKITNSEQKDLISTLEGDSSVSNASYSLQGKIVNVIITVNDDVGIDTAKGLCGKILEKFNDDQKKFYDFQVFIKKKNGENDFPIIGYKQNNKDNFSFTKDRAAS